MSTVTKSLPARPPRPITRPVPPEPEASPFGLRRVRRGRTYDLRAMDEYAWDAYEVRSGLVGHPG